MLHRLALVCLILTAAPAVAQEASTRPAPEPQPNVRVTIRVMRLEQGKPRPVKSYDLVVSPETPGSKLLSGARVPLPVGGSESFIYQNIGFSAEATVWLLPGGKIKLLAQIEDSRLAEPVAGRPPVVETRQLSVNTILSDGQPMVVTKVEGDADPSGQVEVEAKILR
jgi:hypothetical protein